MRDRRSIAGAVDGYLKHRGDTARRHEDVNAFCLKLAKETCLKNVHALPALALAKFRAVANESPAARFDNPLLFGKQREAFVDSLARVLRLSRGLIGSSIHDEDELNRWIDTHYGEIGWFNELNDRWLAVVNAARLPDARYPYPESIMGWLIVPGVPLYFIAALLGVLAMMLRRGQLQPLHIAWGLTLLGFFFTIMLTANVRPRFRFVFEPFWFIYVALLIESALLGARALVRR